MRTRRWSSLALVGGLLATQCRSATALRVASFSEVPCAARARVALVVAHDVAGLRDAPPAAVSTRCSPAGAPFEGENDTGTVVLAPSGAKDDTVVLALMTRPDGEPPESCVDPAQSAKCIVAKRRVAYAPHENVDLPIELRLSCLGVICPAEQTCRKSQCVAATIPRGCVGCGESELAPSSVPVCGAMTGLQAGAAWPMAGFCPTRAGRSGRDGPQTENVRWTFDLGAVSAMSPAVGADGTIYVGSNDQNAYAIDANGRERWHVHVEGNVNGGDFVIGADGTVFVPSGKSVFSAISPTGTVKWSRPIESDGALPASVGPDGTLFVNGLATQGPAPLFAFAPADGASRWRLAPNFGAGSPTFGPDGTLYAGGQDGKLYALDPADGRTKWTATMAQPPRSPSVGDDGTIYAADGRTIDAFTPAGERKWSAPTNGDVDGVAIGPDGTIYVPTVTRRLLAFSPAGALRWTFDTGAGLFSRPAIVGADGTVYAGADDGALYAIAPDGTLRFKVQTGGPIFSQPALGADGTLYVVSTDHKLYAIGP